jgi:hypothetical protein
MGFWRRRYAFLWRQEVLPKSLKEWPELIAAKNKNGFLAPAICISVAPGISSKITQRVARADCSKKFDVIYDVGVEPEYVRK